MHPNDAPQVSLRVQEELPVWGARLISFENQWEGVSPNSD